MSRFFLLILLSAVACRSNTNSEYKVVDSTSSFKYIQFGEGEKINAESILQLKFIVTNEAGDTIHYVPDYTYFVSPTEKKLDSIIRTFNTGDSILLKVDRKNFNDYLKFYKVLQSDSGKVLVHLRILDALTSQQAEAAKQKFLSRRELKEQMLLKKLINKLPDSAEYIDGIYRQIRKKRDGVEVKYGSEVSIDYKGYFLNGYTFDNTKEKSITPSFTFGQEYQMIDGLQTAIKGMKEGESVKIILPSRHAFGEEGSLAGIVPPYTTVIYEVNIIKVIN